jgi:hypothetical protein
MERADQTLASEQENKKPGCPKSRPVVQTCHVQRSCPTEAVLSSTFNPKGDCMLNIWWVVILFLTDSNTGWHFLFMEIDNTCLEDEHSEEPSCTAMGTVVIFVPYTQERGTTT